MYSGVSDKLEFKPAWVSIDDEDQVMSILLRQNKLHPHQAWDIPCAHREGAQDSSKGNFNQNITENLPALNHWLQHIIQRSAPKGSIKVDLTLQQYKVLFKLQDKNTSSSPSGHHYSHYKAALVYDTINQVHAWMMSMLFLNGFTPTRWQTALDFMLEKDVGSPKITHLRIIVIVEGNMNAIMKVIWNCQLVPVVGKTGMLSPVEFGNRKGQTALDALPLKVVTMDCLRLFCLNGAILNNNATTCHD
eukprot:11233059-Ditylum_brightwellii.AAC.1